MTWPWQRPAEPETRAAGTFTDQRVAALLRQVTGAGGADPAGLGAVQAAAGQWARAMAVARIEPDTPLTRAITPSVLYNIGCDLVLGGESVYMLDARPRGGIEVVRCAAWDVHGVTTWWYRLTIGGPSGTVTRRVPAAGVLHPRLNVDPNEPHRGRSAIALAGLTSGAAANLERQVQRESGANHGWVIPAPTAGLTPEDNDALIEDLKGLRGRTAMVPGMESFGDGRPGSHPGNWQSKRIGFDTSDSVVSLRSRTAVSILGACGVPAELVDGNAEGTGRREAWRQFLHGTIQPVADIVAEELTLKLELPVTIGFDRLFASDVQGRARAFASLTAGGLSVADAARATGIQVSVAPPGPSVGS